MEWYTGQRKFARWYTGANKLFNGTQLNTNYFNDIQLKGAAHLFEFLSFGGPLFYRRVLEKRFGSLFELFAIYALIRLGVVCNRDLVE